ncbi:Alpha-galactosidase [Aphelenchoides fujianensis]|nr:Alpha-galactosidase [Aphelenchoides fujianensis]
MRALVLSLFVAIACWSQCGALDNGLVRTPPMGWMSWTRYYCEIDCDNHPFSCINENLYEAQADALVRYGYRDVGYRNVHVDDCWPEWKRGPDSQLVANKTRFPSGIAALAEYMHVRGLNFGIYGDEGTFTCARYPGTLDYEQKDAQTFADWKVDYVKLDGCNLEADQYAKRYPLFTRYLNETKRPIVYSCSWPAYLIDRPDMVNYTEIGQSCNLWRNFDDINSSWGSILSIIQYYVKMQDKHIPTHGPGHWHDPDMLVIGNAGITEGMSRVQMAVWAIWSAPLIMSNDLRTVAPEFQAILQNRDLIAVDQDPLGVMGRMVKQTDQLYYFVKRMTPYDEDRYSFAVAIVNYSPQPANATFVLEDFGLTDPNGYNFKCLWCGKTIGHFGPKQTFTIPVAPVDARIYKATITQRMAVEDLQFLRKQFAKGAALNADNF